MIHAVATLMFMLIAGGAAALIAAMLGGQADAVAVALGYVRTAPATSRPRRRARVSSVSRPVPVSVGMLRAA